MSKGKVEVITGIMEGRGEPDLLVSGIQEEGDMEDEFALVLADLGGVKEIYPGLQVLQLVLKDSKVGHHEVTVEHLKEIGVVVVVEVVGDDRGRGRGGGHFSLVPRKGERRRRRKVNARRWENSKKKKYEKY